MNLLNKLYLNQLQNHFFLKGGSDSEEDYLDELDEHFAADDYAGFDHLPEYEGEDYDGDIDDLPPMDDDY